MLGRSCSHTNQAHKLETLDIKFGTNQAILNTVRSGNG